MEWLKARDNITKYPMTNLFEANHVVSDIKIVRHTKTKTIGAKMSNI